MSMPEFKRMEDKSNMVSHDASSGVNANAGDRIFMPPGGFVSSRRQQSWISNSKGYHMCGVLDGMNLRRRLAHW